MNTVHLVTYSYLFISQGGGNKRKGDAKVPEFAHPMCKFLDYLRSLKSLFAQPNNYICKWNNQGGRKNLRNQ